jgi:hypothetical protein
MSLEDEPKPFAKKITRFRVDDGCEALFLARNLRASSNQTTRLLSYRRFFCSALFPRESVTHI